MSSVLLAFTKASFLASGSVLVDNYVARKTEISWTI